MLASSHNFLVHRTAVQVTYLQRAPQKRHLLDWKGCYLVPLLSNKLTESKTDLNVIKLQSEIFVLNSGIGRRINCVTYVIINYLARFV